jgi:hypothetical protein
MPNRRTLILVVLSGAFAACSPEHAATQSIPAAPAGRYPMQMLQFGWMKPADAAALLSYLRSSFGNSGTGVDAAAVAQALGQ